MAKLRPLVLESSWKSWTNLLGELDFLGEITTEWSFSTGDDQQDNQSTPPTPLTLFLMRNLKYSNYTLTDVGVWSNGTTRPHDLLVIGFCVRLLILLCSEIIIFCPSSYSRVFFFFLMYSDV
jgi:hypothetical protein